MPYNLATYSEQFDNAAWTKSNATISANDTTAPNGTTTADKLIENTVNNNHYAAQNVTAENIAYTYSLYVKANTTTRVRVQMSDLTTGDVRLDYNFTTDTSLFNGSGNRGSWSSPSFSKTDLSEGWVKISISGIKGAGSVASCSVFLLDNSGNSSYTGNGTSGIYIYGAQINSGSTAKTYYPTTTRLNIPRVSYLNNANGSLLLEPQRTNLNTYSEDIPQNYVTTEISDTFEYSTSPNGLQTSTRLQLSNVGSSRYVQTLTGIVSSGTAYTFSCYYKGTIGETAYMYALPVGGTAITKAITFTGEWQRENLTFTAGASSNYVYIVDSRQGGDASDFEVWGAQSEIGSYPTSYIPTSGTTVTRLADTSGTTGLSDVIGSTEGTILLEVAALANETNERRFALSDGTTGNVARVGFTADLNRILAVLYNGSNQCVLNYYGADITQPNKIAFSYNTNDFTLFVNGQERATDASGSTFSANTLTDVHFNEGDGTGNESFGKFHQFQLYKTRLTNSELATLTTI